VSVTVPAVLRFLQRAITVWVGMIFLVAGVIGTVGSALEWRAARQFAADAVTAHATVVGTSFERASRDDGNTSTQYLVTFRFTARDGAVIERTESIPVAEWERLVADDTLDVRYLPSDPESATSRSTSRAAVPLIITGVTALLAVVGLFIARPGVCRALMIWRLERSGVNAEATVIEVGPTGTMINRVQQWQLRYTFRDGAGREQTGQSDLLPPGEAASWRPGDRGVIRYDRNRPSESFWEGGRRS